MWLPVHLVWVVSNLACDNAVDVLECVMSNRQCQQGGMLASDSVCGYDVVKEGGLPDLVGKLFSTFVVEPLVLIPCLPGGVGTNTRTLEPDQRTGGFSYGNRYNQK